MYNVCEYAGHIRICTCINATYMYMYAHACMCLFFDPLSLPPSSLLSSFPLTLSLPLSPPPFYIHVTPFSLFPNLKHTSTHTCTYMYM